MDLVLTRGGGVQNPENVADVMCACPQVGRRVGRVQQVHLTRSIVQGPRGCHIPPAGQQEEWHSHFYLNVKRRLIVSHFKP